MQLLATASQMRELDRTAIEERAIPGLLLMENAGRGFADALQAHRPVGPGTRVAVVAGKGNNGGDGFVIARHLLIRGCTVDVLCTDPPDALRGDGRTNWEILAKLPDARLSLTPSGSAAEASTLPRPDLIVDALVGTGFTGELQGRVAALAAWVNAAGVFVAAVDVASGVDATTGAVSAAAVKADLTVTMGLAKPGLYLGAGREHSGIVVVVDIGIPQDRIGGPAIQRIEAGDAARWLPVRAWNAHKYSVGKVYVLSGSRAFTGAPCLSAVSGLVAGAGAVVLGVPSSIHTAVAAKLAEVIIQPLPETSAGTVSPAGRGEIEERCAWADIVVLGPGLGRHPETDSLVVDLALHLDRPVVLDADALNALAGRAELLKGRAHDTVLTPHAGELGRLTGEKAASIEARRPEAAREAAERFGATVVLKGAPTATAWRDGTVILNSSGNAGMATIGSGDVLTGLLAGLWAQGMRGEQAAAAAVYIHGRAGDEARKDLGMRSMRASDIMRSLPGVLRTFEGA